MNLLNNAHKITEYRIPKNKADIQNKEDNYILRIEDDQILDKKHEAKNLPNTVTCRDCQAKTAEQVDNDQLFKCSECGAETVRTR